MTAESSASLAARRPRVVVIGAAFLDAAFRVPAVPEPGRTTYAEDARLVLGGKGLNQAVAARRMGADVTFVSSVGDDFASRYLREQLEAEGFAPAQLSLDETPDATLPIVGVLVAGDDIRMVASPRRADLPAPRLAERIELLRTADAVLLTLDFGAPLVKAVLDVVKPVADKGRGAVSGSPLVLLNPAPAPEPGELTSDVLRRLDWLVPNEIEARCILGDESSDPELSKLARALRQQSVPAACVTAGKRGSAYVHGTTVERHLGYPVTALDATAASDAFCAALGVCLAEGFAVHDAISAASGAGALAAEHFGASASMPHRVEVAAFLRFREAEQALVSRLEASDASRAVR